MIHKKLDGILLPKNLFESPESFQSSKAILACLLDSEDSSDDGILISYTYLNRYRTERESSRLIDEQLRKFNIPEYATLRFEIKHQGNLSVRGFRLSLKVFNKNQEELKLEQEIGSFFKDSSGREYFLSDETKNFVLAWKQFSADATTPEFGRSQKTRLLSYGKLVQAYDKLEIQGTSYLDIFKVKVIDSIDYNLVGNDDGSWDIVPAFGEDLQKYNRRINHIVENAPQFGASISIPDPGSKKNYRVLFSENVEETWKQFYEIKRLTPSARTSKLKEGEFLSSNPPKEVIGRIFSERLVGFLLESPEKTARDNNSSESWSDGFDDVSNFVRSTSGSAYSIPLRPAPEIYSEIRRGLDKLQTEILVERDKLIAMTGAQETEPILDNKTVYIQSLKDNFDLNELETLTDRIEKTNKPALLEDELESARDRVEVAKRDGLSIVTWGGTPDSPLVIPLKSLEMGVKAAEQEKFVRHSLGVEVANVDLDKSRSTVLPERWYMEDQDEKEMKSSSAFREKISLFPHQVQGYAWLKGLTIDSRVEPICKSRGALLADDMGLGKTIQVIRLIAGMKSEFGNSSKPILIVGPVSLLKTSWEADGLRAFFNEAFLQKYPIHHISEIRSGLSKKQIIREVLQIDAELSNSPDRRFEDVQLGADMTEGLEVFRKQLGSSILLCSYETMRSRIFELASVDFGLIVLDEAQKIKNISAGQSNAAKALKADMKVAMTGTPIENSISDLWNICDFAVPGYLGTMEEFRERFQKPLNAAEPGSIERKQLADTLENSLKPIWLRRTKKEVFKNGEIPPIVHYDSISSPDGTVLNQHLVEMSDEQFAIFENQVGYFNESQSGHKLAAIRTMMEACFAPWHAKNILADAKNMSELFQICPKLKITFDILAGIAAKGEKVLIFANMRELQKELAWLIHQWHFNVFQKSVDCEFFNGEFTFKERQAMMERFKNASGFKALIISPRSGGAGLNLVQANHVIHYTREWNPAVERQATDRAHRIGQTKTVHVYYPTSSTLGRGKQSAEEHLANILREKREVIDDFTISEQSFDLGEEQFQSFDFSTSDTILAPEGIQSLGPYRFEKLVALYLSDQGYETEIVGQAGDKGCDIVCLGPTRNLLVQVKFTEKAFRQGTEAVGQIRGALSYYEQKHDKKFELMAVTNSTFSPNVHSYSVNGTLVELVEGLQIDAFVLKSKIKLSKLR